MAGWQGELRKAAARRMREMSSYELPGQVRFRVNLLLKDSPASRVVRDCLEEAFAAAAAGSAAAGPPAREPGAAPAPGPVSLVDGGAPIPREELHGLVDAMAERLRLGGGVEGGA